MKWPQMMPEVVFPTNPDLARILGRTDFDFEIFCFFDFVSIPNFLTSKLQNSGFPNSRAGLQSFCSPTRLACGVLTVKKG